MLIKYLQAVEKMRGAGVTLCLALCLLLCLQGVVEGQSGRKPEAADESSKGLGKAEDDEVLRVRTEEIVLPVSVRDWKGAPVSGLSEENFLVYDNGVRQEIKSFNQRRVPANIVLLLDASGSVFSRMRFIREAARGFLQGLLPEDHVCLVQFADRVEVLEDWTSAAEVARLEKALNWRYHPGLSTAFYEGLYVAAREPLSRVTGRRIVILLTDGIDTAKEPRASFQDALKAVRRAEASVYVVSLTAALRAEIEAQTGGFWGRFLKGADQHQISLYLKMIEGAEKILNELAAETGGRLFLPLKETEMATAYRAIAEELRTQYIITYKPKPRANAGEYRRLRVLVAPGGYEVAAREGYTGRG